MCWKGTNTQFVQRRQVGRSVFVCLGAWRGSPIAPARIGELLTLSVLPGNCRDSIVSLQKIVAASVWLCQNGAACQSNTFPTVTVQPIYSSVMHQTRTHSVAVSRVRIVSFSIVPSGD